MKSKTNSLFRKLTRVFYASGVVMLLAGMVLSVVATPVSASVAGPRNNPRLAPENYFPITIPVCKNVDGGYVKGVYHLNIPSDYENGLLKWKNWIWAPFVFYSVQRPGQGDQSLLANNCVKPTETVTQTETKTVTVTETKTETPTETITETPTETVTKTITETPTETVTVTLTETLTETPTETPTETLTETPTETLTETPAPLLPLEVSAICSSLIPDYKSEGGPVIVWTAYNPNPSASVASFHYDLDDGAQSGNVVGPIGPLSSIMFTTSGDGSHEMVLTFVDSYYGNVESSKVVDTKVCPVVSETPTETLTLTPSVTVTRVTKTVVVTSTPDPSETPVTRIPTLGQPPASGSGGPVLIPVTGDDLSTNSAPVVSFASLFTNFGMMLLGLGLVFHAASKKFTI